MTAQVALSNVGKTFPASPTTAALHALGPIDLELRRGEFFAVVGPSGCGKSTLLEIIAGLTPATQGSVEFEGRRIDGEAPDSIGVVFQEDASLPWLDVTENVAFGLRRMNATRAYATRCDWLASRISRRAIPLSSPAACVSACASHGRW